MGLRKRRKRDEKERRNAEKRFNKQRLLNTLADNGTHQFAVICDNLKASYNLPKIIRSADAFGAHELHIIGTGFFDPAPARGSFKWVPTTFHQDFQTCYEQQSKRGYSFFTLEPDAKTALTDAQLPKKSAFIFGHEEFGIMFDKENFSAIQSLKIPMFGKVESLNVSIAASIVMYEYIKQHGDFEQQNVEKKLNIRSSGNHLDRLE